MLGTVSQVRQFNNSKPKTSQKIIKIKQSALVYYGLHYNGKNIYDMQK